MRPLPALPARPSMTWRQWLVPRSSEWMSAFLYIGVLLDYVIIHHTVLRSWQTLLVFGSLGLILGLERWEYWRYGEQTPMALRILLFGGFILPIEAVVQTSYEGMGVFLYLILPLRAWLIFGRAAGYGASIGVMAVYSAHSCGTIVTVVVPRSIARAAGRQENLQLGPSALRCGFWW